MSPTRTLSPRQGNMLLWAGLLSPASLYFPALVLPEAGAGAWLPVLLGGLLALVLLDRVPLKGLSPIYMVWTQGVLTAALALGACRMTITGPRDGAPIFFLALLGGLLLPVLRMKRSAFARAAQIVLAALLVGAALVLGFSLPSARWQYLIPREMPPLRSALAAAGVVLAYGLPLKALCRESRKSLWPHVGAVLLLTLAQLVTLAALGPALAGRTPLPFFLLAQAVGVKGAFQRVESVLSALWLWSDLILCGGCLLAQRELLRRLWKREPPRYLLPALLALAVLCAALLLYREELLAPLGRGLLPWGGLALGLLSALAGIWQKRTSEPPDEKT